MEVETFAMPTDSSVPCSWRALIKVKLMPMYIFVQNFPKIAIYVSANVRKNFVHKAEFLASLEAKY